MSEMKAAVLGTNDYHAVMQQAAKDALQRQAGYIAPKSNDALAVMEMSPQSSYTFSSDVEFDREITEVVNWAMGRGWVCGGAAFWGYCYARNGEKPDWIYGDVDVFAHDEFAYQSLVADVTDHYGKEEKDMTVYFELPKVGDCVVTHLNIICPMPGMNWTNPRDVLSTFDINVTKTALIAPRLVIHGFASTYYQPPKEFKPFIRVDTQNIYNAYRTVSRIFKYLGRGCRADETTWHSLIRLEKTAPLLRVLGALSTMKASDMKTVIDEIASEVEDFDTPEPDYYEEDEYESGWY